jgi:hypothetical protein
MNEGYTYIEWLKVKEKLFDIAKINNERDRILAIDSFLKSHVFETSCQYLIGAHEYDHLKGTEKYEDFLNFQKKSLCYKIGEALFKNQFVSYETAEKITDARDRNGYLLKEVILTAKAVVFGYPRITFTTPASVEGKQKVIK